MAQTCIICAHPERQTIENALGEGASYRDIAGQFGVSKDCLFRHSKAHLEPDRADVEPAVIPQIDPEPEVNRDTSNPMQQSGIDDDRRIITNEKRDEVLAAPDRELSSDPHRTDGELQIIANEKRDPAGHVLPIMTGGLTLGDLAVISAVMEYNLVLARAIELMRRGW